MFDFLSSLLDAFTSCIIMANRSTSMDKISNTKAIHHITLVNPLGHLSTNLCGANCSFGEYVTYDMVAF